MKTTTTAVAAAGMLALASVMVPAGADAGCNGCGIAAGIIGGVAAGAIIGGAIANSAWCKQSIGAAHPADRTCDGSL